MYRLGFVMEQTLGHVTHDRNLRQWVAADGDVMPEWMPVHYVAPDIWQRAPFVRSNWTVRGSLRAVRAVRATLRRVRLDGLLCHTQVVGLLLPALMRRLPTVVSLDATPLNLDTLAAAYDHRPSAVGAIERLKNRLNRRVLHRARRLVTWSSWAKESLVRDYGVPDTRVEVIPPGIDLTRWSFERVPVTGRALRLLFVGGDFRRKGGDLLVEVYRDHLRGRCEVDVVTRDQVTAPDERFRVHHGLTPNSPELMRLYEEADAFVFPTLGDCLPIAVMEAMAAELPVIATRVGAIHEEVADGSTGLLVEPGSADALLRAVERLLDDSDVRVQMGRAARKRAEELFNGERNYRRLIAVCKECADAG